MRWRVALTLRPPFVRLTLRPPLSSVMCDLSVRDKSRLKTPLGESPTSVLFSLEDRGVTGDR